jgi:3-phosphoglycerate kinase
LYASASACGSFRNELAPGSFVLVDQFVDRTHKRESSFFGKGCVAHVSMAHPISPLLRIHLADGMILDVGPQSIARIHAAIDDAATLVWNGPLGAFEMTPFDRGTVVSARHAAERTKAKKLISVAGGGDTVAALNQAGVAGDFSYVSTAGGAFLEWMEGKPLPGVEVLKLR